MKSSGKFRKIFAWIGRPLPSILAPSAFSSNMTSVGERIRQRRSELGWTQEQLAREAALSKGFLSDLEAGKRSVGADSLLALATALGVTMDYLMRGDPTSPQTTDVHIPGSLSAFAKSAALTYAQTVMLLDLQRQIIAHRSTSKSDDLEKVDWRRFYESVREFLK